MIYRRPSRWTRFLQWENIINFQLRRWWMMIIDFISVRRTKQCAVTIFYGYRCTNYTFSDYCTQHRRLMALECAKYHMEDYIKIFSKDPIAREKIGDKNAIISLVLIAELQARKDYRIKYGLTADKPHIDRERSMVDRINLARTFELHGQTQQIVPFGQMEEEILEAQYRQFNLNRDYQEEEQMRLEAALEEEIITYIQQEFEEDNENSDSEEPWE